MFPRQSPCLSGHSGHVLFASCMASIHHLIGWHALLLPSSPWQCECPPVSHHHGNGSVPQQPSAWAECKPLNHDHHGNVCLLEHWAVECQWACASVCQKWEGGGVSYSCSRYISSDCSSGILLPICALSLRYYLSRAQFFTSRCVLLQRRGWVLLCRTFPKWGLAGGLNSTN